MANRLFAQTSAIADSLRKAAKEHALAPKKRGPKPGNAGGNAGRGRPKGSFEITTKGFIAKALKDGKLKSPLEFMMEVMNNPRVDWELRLKAAQGAAPYIHHKLLAQQIEASIVAETQDQRMARLANLVLEAENDDLLIEGRVEAAE